MYCQKTAKAVPRKNMPTQQRDGGGSVRLAWLGDGAQLVCRALLWCSQSGSLQDGEGTVCQQCHFFFADDVRRHEIDGAADGAQQELARERLLEEAPAEAGTGAGDLESPDHAQLAQILHGRVVAQRLQSLVEERRLALVGGEHPVLLEDVEACQGGAAGKQVAGVGVGVQGARGGGGRDLE